jgi:hypothetical protein
MADVLDDYVSAFEDTLPAVVEDGFTISLKRLGDGQWLAAARGTCLSGLGATEAEALAAVRKALRADYPAARTIEQVLRRHYGASSELPQVQALVWAGVALAQYERAPWSDRDGEQWTGRARIYTAQKRVLENAARILASDPARLQAKTSDWGRALERAVAVLQTARGGMHPEIRNGSRQGPPMRGWSHVARELTRRLTPPLRALDVPASTRKTSPFVKSLRDLLVLIYGEEKAPSCSAISKAITNFDAKN